MPMPTADTIDSVEMAWIFANAVGLVIAVLGLIITNKNLKAAHRAVKVAKETESLGPLHVGLARESVRTESIITSVLTIKIMVFLMFLFAGYLASLTVTPPVPVEAAGVQVRIATITLFIISAFALMLTAILLTADSMLRRKARHTLINRIAAKFMREQLELRGMAPLDGGL